MGDVMVSLMGDSMGPSKEYRSDSIRWFLEHGPDDHPVSKEEGEEVRISSSHNHNSMYGENSTKTSLTRWLNKRPQKNVRECYYCGARLLLNRATWMNFSIILYDLLCSKETLKS